MFTARASSSTKYQNLHIFPSFPDFGGSKTSRMLSPANGVRCGIWVSMDTRSPAWMRGENMNNPPFYGGDHAFVVIVLDVLGYSDFVQEPY